MTVRQDSQGANMRTKGLSWDLWDPTGALNCLPLIPLFLDPGA